MLWLPKLKKSNCILLFLEILQKRKIKEVKMEEFLASFWSPLILTSTLFLISRILMIATWSRYEPLDLVSPLRLTAPSPPSFRLILLLST